MLRWLRVISHGGRWAGFRCHFLRFPEQRYAVATFCNFSTSGPDSLARKVAGIYLGDQMQPDSAAMWTASLAAAPHRQLPVESLRRLVGEWRNEERGAGPVSYTHLRAHEAVLAHEGRLPLLN